MHMKKLGRYMGITVLGTSLLVSGCATLGDGDKTWKGAAIGTAGGAALGAAIGATQGNAAQGALWGAVGGAVIGTTTGVLLDRQEEQLRQAGIRTQRDANGRLLLNLSGETLKFDTGKATLKPEGMAQLDTVASILRAHPENRIAIAGHTDSVGSADGNLSLSQARADSVKWHLLGQGVPSQCVVSSVGYGEDYPLADNSTTQGRSQNRRVELNISLDEKAARATSQN